MTRPYALKRLLEHGPMTPKEITACTRWTSKQVHRALDTLLEAELIERKDGRYVSAHFAWINAVAAVSGK